MLRTNTTGKLPGVILVVDISGSFATLLQLRWQCRRRRDSGEDKFFIKIMIDFLSLFIILKCICFYGFQKKNLFLPVKQLPLSTNEVRKSAT